MLLELGIANLVPADDWMAPGAVCNHIPASCASYSALEKKSIDSAPLQIGIFRYDIYNTPAHIVALATPTRWLC